MSRVKNETGNKYGLLTVLERDGSICGKAAWLCQCECGKQIRVTGDALRRGQAKTCGNKEHRAKRMSEIGKNNAIDITGQKFNI